MSDPQLLEPKSRRGTPTWESSRLFPEEGGRSDAEYLGVFTRQLIEFTDGVLEFQPENERGKVHFQDIAMTPNTIHLADTTMALVDEAARQAGVSENGQPAFELAPVETDDFMSDLIESNADFRENFSNRRGGKFVSADEALRRLKD